MKKSTQKTIMALIIILIFGLSSVAYMIVEFASPQQQQKPGDFKPLTSSVVNGQLDPVYKQTYVGAGYTWIEYYSSQNTLSSFLDSLPSMFTNLNGQPQIVVQNLNSNDTERVIITSQSGTESLSQPTTDQVFSALCGLLTFKPIECQLANETNSSSANATP